MKRNMFLARAVLIVAFYLLGYATLSVQQPINLLLKTGSPTEIFYLCVSPDGKTLAAYSRSHSGGPVTLNLWDIAQGTRIRLLDDAEYVGRMAFSPDGKFLVAVMGNAKTDIGIW
ncbi:MAG: WD40 repeat domain-containing protein [Spirochaetaceae bacterium]|nr:WD40 repeat domain-containing protein [Spirochaetaceae bacterium]